ncbi:MAG: phosphoenolpyruvate synthase, partial [Candidatus Saganbacteria bacterium]|nr:phosphoenolpyruvate synthase [Candidatus Saganbacteria bacterium]
MNTLNTVSTGIKGLDNILQSLRKGDNVVWQVDNLDSYKHFLKPYIEQSLKDNRNLVYIRFAKHPPVVEPNEKIKTYELDASSGFESFSKQLHDIITKEGVGAFYIFDCLSDLISAWATDLMIGNFFMVTCPYLFKLDTIAYFAILRDNHSFKTIARIRETTQLLLDVYNFEGTYYVHPLKVWNRHSPTMFLPHLEEGEKFSPLINSVDATRLFSYLSSRSAERYLDYWDHLFLDAEELLKKPSLEKEKEEMADKLIKIIMGREPRMVELVKKHFSLKDIIEIKARMIGTGFIGGKTVGMLLARKILKQDQSMDWSENMEPHDSFFIGSDVFYTYIVENGWWDLWLEQKSKAGYLRKAVQLRSKMLKGKFPEEIKDQFHQIIEYFGQSPIIIRSSSLLEDSFGNAFAGKYESLFLANQGNPEDRYLKFEDTVRQIFASTLNEDALTYRLQRGLSQLDEQMALLVQRVSGSYHKSYFFPFLAGVGFSYNTFVWDKNMDPLAGMLRLVLGLGTRAVNRVEGDYPSIVALDNPLLKPYAGIEGLRKFSQHEIDLLNLGSNEPETLPLSKLLEEKIDLDMGLIGKRDRETENKMREIGMSGEAWVLTFEKLLSETDFAGKMQKLLKTLENSYQYPVDVEFTANMNKEEKLQINLVQCRPLQAKGSGGAVKIPKNIPKESVIFKSESSFMGGSIILPIQRIIYINPETYGDLLIAKKYELARLIGKLNKKIGDKEKLPTLLIGPG